jgi:hypothetical protein
MRLVLIKKIMVSFVLLLFIFVLFGCNEAIPTTPSPTDETYTITVVSGNVTVWGNVWVDGSPSGDYLSSNSSVVISGVTAGAAITLVDELDYVSHTEHFYPPNTTIVFDWF